MGVKASVSITNMRTCNCGRLLVLLELLCSWTLRTLTLYNRSAKHQFKCVNAYASVYTIYLAVISPFLERVNAYASVYTYIPCSDLSIS